MMRNGLCAMIVTAATMIIAPSNADEPKCGSIGADALAALPVDDWEAAGAGVGVGAVAVGEYSIASCDLALTLRAGYVYHLPKSDVPGDPSFREVPLLGGVIYKFNGPYIAADLGVVWLTHHSEAYAIQSAGFTRDFPEASTTEASLMVSAGAGYKLGDLDFRAQVILPAVDQEIGWFGVAMTAGYRFIRF